MSLLKDAKHAYASSEVPLFVPQFVPLFGMPLVRNVPFFGFRFNGILESGTKNGKSRNERNQKNGVTAQRKNIETNSAIYGGV